MAKLTLAALIDKAKAPRQKKTAALNIPSLGGEIIVQEPDFELFNEALELAGKGGDEYLIYNSVLEPNLRDAQLQQVYGCSEPTDIVRKVFSDGEVAQIARQIIELGGYRNTVKVVEEIKN